jgi:Zn-dependent protease
MMGWASAPYDPDWARRFPRRAAVMALAGPAANLLLVLAASAAIRGGMAAGIFKAPERISFTQVTASAGDGPLQGVVVPLSLLFSLNLLLCIFNLLPLPPLDGSAVLPALLPPQAAERYGALMTQPYMSLLGLIVAWQLFNPIYYPIQLAAIRLLYPGVGYG